MEVCEPKSIPINFSSNQIRAAQESSHGMLHFTSCSNELPPQTLIHSFLHQLQQGEWDRFNTQL